MKVQALSRRQFLKTTGAGLAACTAPALLSSCTPKQERPNILWLTSEDNSPYLGCYGDPNANTPNLDRLAAEGILYENAFANAPVCAPARNTLVTGMYACSLGTHHMRSKNPIPEFVKFYGNYLREAGYYCTNNHKEDYNVRQKPEGCWDESSRTATYYNRKPGQPFFAVFNHTVSHESSLHKQMPELAHDPAKMKIPPYHPDTPEVRRDWAQYYDKITELDRQIGEKLKQLEDDGLAEDTIVLYYADHGGVLTRSKRFLYDTGTRVPLIIRFPKKYQHLAPGKPGTRTDRLVSFVDFAPSMLSLAGVPIPDHMQGEAFLGSQARPPRDYVYFFRGRMDERYDMMRAVCDKRFRYIRNYMPHLIYGQYLNYLWKMPTTRVWEKMYKEGKTHDVQNYFWETKPMEELYDTQADPWEVNNLVDKPEYRDVLQRMRAALKTWVLDIRDAGFIPEAEMMIRSEGRTPYEMARDPNSYNLPRYLEVVDVVNQRDAANLHRIQEYMNDPDSAVRYWGAVGCLALGQKAMMLKASLFKLLEDSAPDVRIVAAEALGHIGEEKKAIPVLKEALAHPNPRVQLRAANAIDYLDEKARSALPAIKNVTDKYVQRVMEKAYSDLGIMVPTDSSAHQDEKSI